jgi:hypothetical protein
MVKDVKLPAGTILVPEMMPGPELTKKGAKKKPRRMIIFCGRCHESIGSLSCMCWSAEEESV